MSFDGRICPAAISSQGDGEFRRTRILRDPGVAPVPEPGPRALRELPVRGAVPDLERGGDVRAVLENAYRDRGPERVEPGRLGSATWGTGRGAAPPRFDAP
jgi:hypothetical protein